MWVFLCFGFPHGRLVNCFYLSIPFCDGDIPVSLVEVGKTATPGGALEFGDGEA
jgi:hypothetical protein